MSASDIITALEEKLIALNDSQASIKGTSKWIVENVAHADTIARSWASEILKAASQRKLVLLYLVNDVIQYSKSKRIMDYIKAFADVLPGVLDKSARTLENVSRERLLRMLDMWVQRNVYSQKFVDRLKQPVVASVGQPPSGSKRPADDYASVLSALSKAQKSAPGETPRSAVGLLQDPRDPRGATPRSAVGLLQDPRGETPQSAVGSWQDPREVNMAPAFASSPAPRTGPTRVALVLKNCRAQTLEQVEQLPWEPENEWEARKWVVGAVEGSSGARPPTALTMVWANFHFHGARYNAATEAKISHWPEPEAFRAGH